MCLAPPTIQAPTPTPPPPPPPPPATEVKPPTLAPQVDQQKSQADAKRKGTQIFRNDLSIPTSGGSAAGNGINIPK